MQSIVVSVVDSDCSFCIWEDFEIRAHCSDSAATSDGFVSAAARVAVDGCIIFAGGSVLLLVAVRAIDVAIAVDKYRCHN